MATISFFLLKRVVDHVPSTTLLRNLKVTVPLVLVDRTVTIMLVLHWKGKIILVGQTDVPPYMSEQSWCPQPVGFISLVPFSSIAGVT